MVKTLNTVNARVMVEPELVPGPHTLFLCGDEAAAKGEVAELLGAFGWPAEEIVDLGDLSAARGMEMYLPLWLRLSAAKGTPQLNVRLVTA